MLKIKDSVDLKELEKFGFNEYTKDGYGIDTSNDAIEILVDSHEIGINVTSGFDWLVIQDLDIIFDLIQAGLVEKVEENE